MAWLLPLWVWLCPAPSMAGPSPQIPEACGSQSEFQSELGHRLGREITTEATRVVLTPEEGGFRLVVEVGSERRELHDQSCQELLRAAVVIALALLDPKPEELPIAAAELPRPQPRRTQSAPARFALGGGGGVHFGTVPQPTLLLDFDAQLKWAHWGVAGGVRYLAPTSVRDQTQRGVRVSGVGADLVAIFEPWPRVQYRLGLVVYRLSGIGLGSVQYNRDTAWEAGPLIAASFSPYERRPFWTSVGAEGELNVLRAHFDIQGYGRVFQVPWSSGSLFVRAGVVW